MNEESIFHGGDPRTSPEDEPKSWTKRAAVTPACGQALRPCSAPRPARSFLETAPPRWIPRSKCLPLAEIPGAVIAGRYKLLEEIGEGGMGTVWVAEQMQPVRRKVAVKLIKPAWTQNRAGPFRGRAAGPGRDGPPQHRQGTGRRADGIGPALLRHGVRQRRADHRVLRSSASWAFLSGCELFVEVCQAVQHAHQKGIIHRDLKPSNILVAPYDGRPVPKVIDFGLAKAMNQSLTERTLHGARDGAGHALVHVAGAGAA